MRDSFDVGSRPEGAVLANQFDNTANRQAHIEVTGPEIWYDIDGCIDGFICDEGSSTESYNRSLNRLR